MLENYKLDKNFATLRYHGLDKYPSNRLIVVARPSGEPTYQYAETLEEIERFLKKELGNEFELEVVETSDKDKIKFLTLPNAKKIVRGYYDRSVNRLYSYSLEKCLEACQDKADESGKTVLAIFQYECFSCGFAAGSNLYGMHWAYHE